MKLGIVQGRLSRPRNGQIQDFPEDWEAEFRILPSVGLSHVEWIVNETFLHADIVGVPCQYVSSLCLDTMISPDFSNSDFLIDQIRIGIGECKKIGVSNLTVPFLEQSSLRDPQVFNGALESIHGIASELHGIHISFETDLTNVDMLERLVHCSDGFSLTYDTGNLTPYVGQDTTLLQNIVSYVSNVHLKDKNSIGQSVAPGAGITPFQEIFNVLGRVGYNGLFTLQFARGETGREIDTVKQYVEWFWLHWRKQCINTI